MREDSMAHFEEVRLKNTRLIRNLMRDYEKLGKSDLAKLSGLSFPTVSAILKSLVEAEEVQSLSETISNGGRPAEVFTLNAKFQYAACSRLNGFELETQIYDTKGQEVDTFREIITEKDDVGKIIEIYKAIKEDYPRLSAIALGIPGVVQDGKITYLPHFPKLEQISIKAVITKALGVEVFLENDVNAIVYAEREKWHNVAHILMAHGCIGVGIILEKQLVRGAHGAAGELEWVCQKQEDMTKYLAQCIAVITSVIDVPDIALSGADIKSIKLAALTEEVGKILPNDRIPKLHKVVNEQACYQRGLWLKVLDEWREK